MADYTNVTWAQQVLKDLGVPDSGNNLTFMLQWMASENNPATWTGTAGANNPLNNGYGSGGGDGTGSYPDLTTAAEDVAKNLATGNYGYNNITALLRQNAPPNETASAVWASSWAGGHYGYGSKWNTSASASDPIGQAQSASSGATRGVSAGSGGGGPVYPNMTAQEGAALKAAMNEPGGAAYLSAASGGQAAAQAEGSIGFTGQSFTGTAEQESALSAMAANFAAYGFTGQQVNQDFVSFAWNEIVSGTDPTQIAIDIQTPGSAAYPVFAAKFPYFVQANGELNAKGLPAISVQAYQQYEVNAFAQAQAAGLPPGFMTQKEVGQLIGNNVSTTELSARMNDAVTIGLNSTLEQQQQFNQYFGVSYGDSGHGPLSPGQLAALALDPNHAEPLIKQQIQAAQIGGASVTSGVGSLGVQTALELARAGISTSQATSTFQNLAPYATLEHARPGEHGEAAQGVVSPTQLATGALLGNTAAERQLQTAVEVAKAPFSGGGGFVQNAKGAAGTGSASPTGVGGT